MNRQLHFYFNMCLFLFINQNLNLFGDFSKFVLFRFFIFKIKIFRLHSKSGYFPNQPRSFESILKILTRLFTCVCHSYLIRFLVLRREFIIYKSFAKIEQIRATYIIFFKLLKCIKDLFLFNFILNVTTVHL